MGTPGSPPKRPPPPPPARGPAAPKAAAPTPIAIGPDVGRAAEKPHQPRPSGGSGKVVLVVDDDKATRDLIVRALSAEFAPHGAESAAQALAWIDTAGAPDAAIIDVMMPGMDGLELARQLKARADCALVSVMFLTARGSSADIIAGIRAGARHYLIKPFKLDELMEKVGKMVKR